MITSESLPPDSGQTGSVDILRSSGEHLAMDTEILNLLELRGSGPHGLSGVSFAHSGCFVSSFSIINSSGSVITALPTMLNRGIVAG